MAKCGVAPHLDSKTARRKRARLIAGTVADKAIATMIITYAPDNPNEPVWFMEEIVDDSKKEWWRVRLWTGEIQDYATRVEASEAYWR